MVKQSKRDAILVAALAEFADRGFHGARIERIAAGAGANKQLIFHYFASKDGLYGAAVSHLLSTRPRPTSDGHPPDAIRRFVVDLVNWFVRTPGAAMALSECLSDVGVPAGAAATARSWIDGVSADVVAIVTDGQRQGHFRDDLNHRSVVELILGTSVGHSLTRFPGELSTRQEPPFGSVLGQMVAWYCGWH